jgi:hypothetical protein
MQSLLRHGWTVVAFLALVSLGCGGGDQKGKAPAPQGDTPAKGDADKGQPREPTYKLTAEEFTRDFLKNEKEAQQKYQGMRVELTGQVFGISTPDAGKTAVVQLEGAKKKEKDIVGVLIQVALKPEQARTGLHLSRKQKVKITADFERAFGASIINLTGGSLEELGKSEVVAVKAADLAAEFAEDPKAAAGKYDKKEMVVTGEVADVSKKGDFHYARLKGDGKVSVLVTVGADESRALAKGKTASLRAESGFPPFEKNEVRLQGGSVVEVK